VSGFSVPLQPLPLSDINYLFLRKVS